MIRNGTACTNLVLERVIASSKQPRPPVNRLLTWLNTQHFTQNPLDYGSRRLYATRLSNDKSKDASEEPKLPRFLRRQHLQKNAAEEYPHKPTNQRTPPPPQTPTTYRSKHFDPSSQKPKGEIRLLEPHILSSRLKKLCDAGKVDDAVYMLKNAPLDAQNTPVWNTLIWECLKSHRYQLAYQLYVDMKRRGFSPTTRTFQTFFNGLSRIDDWVSHSKQLTNANALYEAYQRHIDSVRKLNPEDPELSIDPLAGYIRILGNAGRYQKLFDVYYAMDQQGPLAPNPLVFTAMFQAISASRLDSALQREKVASDARLLWQQMLKASQKAPGFPVDSYIAASAITALSGGTERDHELAFQIASQYYGLVVGQPTSSPSPLPLRSEAFAAVLRLCNQHKHHSICSQFLQQVKRRPESAGGASILDRGHMEEVLGANLAKPEPGLGSHALETLEWMLRQELSGPNGPQIRPALSTYSLVMQSCWRCGDWRSATRAFELMTGYHTHDFADGNIAEKPRLGKRGPGRSLPPNADIMSYMLRTALFSQSRANMRQALRIVAHLGLERLLNKRSKELGKVKNAVRRIAVFPNKLISAVVDTADNLLNANGSVVKPEDAQKWRQLRKLAKETLENKLPKPTKAIPPRTRATAHERRRHPVQQQ